MYATTNAKTTSAIDVKLNSLPTSFMAKFMAPYIRVDYELGKGTGLGLPADVNVSLEQGNYFEGSIRHKCDGPRMH